MEKVKNYISEAYNELVHKVDWPHWNELQSTASVVIIAMILFSLVVLLMDVLSDMVIFDLIYKTILG